MKRRVVMAASYEWFDNMKSNSMYKKLQKACELHGYVLGTAIIHVISDNSIELQVGIRRDENSKIFGKYLPQIKVVDNGTVEPIIQVITYNKVTLDENEFGLYALAVQHANHLVKLLLEEIDWSKLYRHEVK